MLLNLGPHVCIFIIFLSFYKFDITWKHEKHRKNNETQKNKHQNITNINNKHVNVFEN